ncbi:MAG: AAA family ATPase [Dehalococcoidia bacterium]
MRPLELTINGFRSYAQETRFDWRGRHLVGVVGPIGSGKSSILDAIAFALYGKTPTFASSTGALINQRQQVAQVSLVFRVDGQAWQVVRAIRRTGQGNHTLYPYDEATGEVDRGAGVSGVKAVNDRVEQLLGLDFDAFRRSVLLAQNRFAEFLNATPTDRDKVLQGVFNLDRITAMQAVAKDRVAETASEAKAIEGRVADAATARGRIAERRERRAAHAQRHAALEAARPAIEEQTKAEVDARAQATAAAKRIADLDGLRTGLPPAAESNATIDGFAALAERMAAARAAREQAEAGETAARTAREAALAEAGGPERLEAAASALQARAHARDGHAAEAKRRDSARAALEAAQAAVQAAKATEKSTAAEAKKAETALAKAEAAVTAADEALHAAERLDFAITLREGIAAGDDCPVCGRKIAAAGAHRGHACRRDRRRRREAGRGRCGGAGDGRGGADRRRGDAPGDGGARARPVGRRRRGAATRGSARGSRGRGRRPPDGGARGAGGTGRGDAGCRRARGRTRRAGDAPPAPRRGREPPRG